MKNDYLGLNPNQKFYIQMDEKGLVIGRNEPLTYSINETVKHQSLHAERSVDGHFYILVLDETTGAYCLPRCWKHIIRIKDHKEILIPGGHKPNKDGGIDCHFRLKRNMNKQTITTILLALVAILYQGTMNKEIIEKIQFVGIG